MCEKATVDHVVCPAGYYTDEVGQSECTECPEGYFCTGGSHRVSCPAGHYCAAGCSSPVKCPDGYYSNGTTGLIDEDQCLPCPVGHYCVFEEDVASEPDCWDESDDYCVSVTTDICDAGYICRSASYTPTPGKLDDPVLSLMPATIGEPCPIGFICSAGCDTPTFCTTTNTWTFTVGCSSEDDCQPCQSGFICTGVSPQECPVGYYCPYPVDSDGITKIACSAGTYNNLTQRTLVTDCLDCPEGYYCPRDAVASYLSFPCPAGMYCGAHSIDPVECPAGTYRSSTLGTSLTDCLACPEGYYCPEACVKPVQCVRGTFCPAGSEEPTTCPSGTIGNASLSTLRIDEETSCSSCPAGYYCDDTAGLSQEVCDAGYICSGGAKTATPVDESTDGGYECPAGYYCPQYDDSGQPLVSPIPCPSGTYNPKKKATDESSCVSCGVNSFSFLPGRAACNSCGESSNSSVGSITCECTGRFRTFQRSDKSCVCQPGYTFTDELGNESPNSDSKLDCQPIIKSPCGSQEVYDSYGRCISTQMTEEEAQDSMDCIVTCPNGKAVYSYTFGTCVCAGEEAVWSVCGDDCQANASVLSTPAVSSSQLSLVNEGDGVTLSLDGNELAAAGFIGSLECTRSDECLTTYTSLSSDGFVSYYDVDPQVLYDRITGTRSSLSVLSINADLMSHSIQNNNFVQSKQTSSSFSFISADDDSQPLFNTPISSKAYAFESTGITNPIVCLRVGDVILFDVVSGYVPQLVTTSALTDNTDLDVGPLRQALSNLSQSDESTVVGLPFDSVGHYVLQPINVDTGDKIDVLMYVNVVDDGEGCKEGESIRSATEVALAEAGFNTVITQSISIEPSFFLLYYILIVCVTSIFLVLGGYSLYAHLTRRDREKMDTTNLRSVDPVVVTPIEGVPPQLIAYNTPSLLDDLTNSSHAIVGDVANDIEEVRELVQISNKSVKDLCDFLTRRTSTLLIDLSSYSKPILNSDDTFLFEDVFKKAEREEGLPSIGLDPSHLPWSLKDSSVTSTQTLDTSSLSYKLTNRYVSMLEKQQTCLEQAKKKRLEEMEHLESSLDDITPLMLDLVSTFDLAMNTDDPTVRAKVVKRIDRAISTLAKKGKQLHSSGSKMCEIGKYKKGIPNISASHRGGSEANNAGVSIGGGILCNESLDHIPVGDFIDEDGHVVLSEGINIGVRTGIKRMKGHSTAFGMPSLADTTGSARSEMEMTNTSEAEPASGSSDETESAAVTSRSSSVPSVDPPTTSDEPGVIFHPAPGTFILLDSCTSLDSMISEAGLESTPKVCVAITSDNYSQFVIQPSSGHVVPISVGCVCDISTGTCIYSGGYDTDESRAFHTLLPIVPLPSGSEESYLNDFNEFWFDKQIVPQLQKHEEQSLMEIAGNSPTVTASSSSSSSNMIPLPSLSLSSVPSSSHSVTHNSYGFDIGQDSHSTFLECAIVVGVNEDRKRQIEKRRQMFIKTLKEQDKERQKLKKKKRSGSDASDPDGNVEMPSVYLSPSIMSSTIPTITLTREQYVELFVSGHAHSFASLPVKTRPYVVPCGGVYVDSNGNVVPGAGLGLYEGEKSPLGSDKTASKKSKDDSLYPLSMGVTIYDESGRDITCSGCTSGRECSIPTTACVFDIEIPPSDLSNDQKLRKVVRLPSDSEKELTSESDISDGQGIAGLTGYTCVFDIEIPPSDLSNDQKLRKVVRLPSDSEKELTSESDISDGQGIAGLTGYSGSVWGTRDLEVIRSIFLLEHAFTRVRDDVRALQGRILETGKKMKRNEIEQFMNNCISVLSANVSRYNDSKHSLLRLLSHHISSAGVQLRYLSFSKERSEYLPRISPSFVGSPSVKPEEREQAREILADEQKNRNEFNRNLERIKRNMEEARARLNSTLTDLSTCSVGKDSEGKRKEVDNALADVMREHSYMNRLIKDEMERRHSEADRKQMLNNPIIDRVSEALVTSQEEEVDALRRMQGAFNSLATTIANKTRDMRDTEERLSGTVSVARDPGSAAVKRHTKLNELLKDMMTEVKRVGDTARETKRKVNGVEEVVRAGYGAISETVHDGWSGDISHQQTDAEIRRREREKGKGGFVGQSGGSSSEQAQSSISGHQPTFPGDKSQRSTTNVDGSVSAKEDQSISQGKNGGTSGVSHDGNTTSDSLRGSLVPENSGTEMSSTFPGSDKPL
ncbi:hypothetical protein ADUPG1_000549, partial [Aduncisulcus paluster]